MFNKDQEKDMVPFYVVGIAAALVGIGCLILDKI